MRLEIRRIIIFTVNMVEMARFYRDVMGLQPVADEDNWKDFRAGTCNIALHKGASAVGKRPPKLAFYAADVAAMRATLIKRGAAMGKLIAGRDIDMCDGKDPDGNPFTISSRT
jgi:catechol 2,3-dioxygenase-like lactoylglutathione lyase family enzyme